VRLQILAASIDGLVENVSASGLLFFSDGDLRVEVEVEEDGRVQRRTGRLVRVQRMRGESLGWAVEFDAA